MTNIVKERVSKGLVDFYLANIDKLKADYPKIYEDLVTHLYSKISSVIE